MPSSPDRIVTPRIGIHLSSAGGIFTAADRAHAIGANTFQIFSSSPRMWRPMRLPADNCRQMRELRQRYDCSPLVVHASYLVNLCSQSSEVRDKSVTAFRGEVERAMALGAEYLVVHPGSWRGLTRQDGLRLAAESIGRATDGIIFDGCDFRILIENSAGAEFSLGGSFEGVAELALRLKPVVPIGVCLDTCHCHVAGYDLVSPEGYEETARQIGSTIGHIEVRVWHMNDAKAARGSRLDRHQHLGQGTMGLESFRRLVNDARFAHSAFIAETPIDDQGDDLSNVLTLRGLLRRNFSTS